MRTSKKNPPGLQLVVPMAAEWISSNAREHWAPRNRKTRAWRSAAMIVARSSGASYDVPVDLEVVVSKRRESSRWDPHNLWPTAKACIDGIVDAGLLEDDDTKHIRSTSIRAGEPDRLRPGMTITIRPVQEDQP